VRLNSSGVLSLGQDWQQLIVTEEVETREGSSLWSKEVVKTFRDLLNLSIVV
jgi:hypothetical protein